MMMIECSKTRAIIKPENVNHKKPPVGSGLEKHLSKPNCLQSRTFDECKQSRKICAMWLFMFRGGDSFGEVCNCIQRTAKRSSGCDKGMRNLVATLSCIKFNAFSLSSSWASDKTVARCATWAIGKLGCVSSRQRYVMRLTVRCRLSSRWGD